jgi:tRNA (cytidine/uridine-2'-O-)-methyltransferase
MLHIILYRPEIPPNTGNIIRLCANTGAQLHLIRPYGFDLDDKRLRRAGLDYHEFTSVKQYDSLEEVCAELRGSRIFSISTRGKLTHTAPTFVDGDAFLFGQETKGLPPEWLQVQAADRVLRLPMLADSRSMNLSNAASVILYEAWRQLDFIGGA